MVGRRSLAAIPYCARASSTRPTAIRISRLLASASLIKALRRASVKNSLHPRSELLPTCDATALALRGPALLTASLSGYCPGTGMAGRSYLGASEQPASASQTSTGTAARDRKRVVEGTSGSVRVDLGGPRYMKKKK